MSGKLKPKLMVYEKDEVTGEQSEFGVLLLVRPLIGGKAAHVCALASLRPNKKKDTIKTQQTEY